MSRLFALVPAAGKSARMGQPKLRLPLGDRTVIEHVVLALRRAEVDDVIVVIGPHVAELAPLVGRAGGGTCVLKHETPDMRATVLLGLERIEALHKPAAEDHWLLIPADHPVLEPSVVRELVTAQRANREQSIFIPLHNDQRGHPALLSWTHVAGIRAAPADEGINKYLRRQRNETLEVPTASASVLIDLDTPEDYARIRRDWRQ